MHGISRTCNTQFLGSFGFARWPGSLLALSTNGQRVGLVGLCLSDYRVSGFNGSCMLCVPYLSKGTHKVESSWRFPLNCSSECNESGAVLCCSMMLYALDRVAVTWSHPFPPFHPFLHEVMYLRKRRLQDFGIYLSNLDALRLFRSCDDNPVYYLG